MSTATENLKNDHVHIIKITDIMEQVAQSKDPDIKHLETILELIKKFADGFHHAKEENLLFPLLGEKGFPKEQGPVAVMLHEHESGRNFVKNMSENINLYKKGDVTTISAIRENMLGYVNLLRNHIEKENNILFRMADNVLDNNEQEVLLNQFEDIGNDLGSATIQNYLLQIQNLSNAYNI